MVAPRHPVRCARSGLVSLLGHSQQDYTCPAPHRAHHDALLLSSRGFVNGLAHYRNRPDGLYGGASGRSTEEWRRTIRPRIPGPVLQMVGAPKDRPGEVVFVALTRDEATYRALAAMPEQDAWFRRFVEHIEGEPTWEDVEMEILHQS